jgi:DNA-binding response OmpR family regulator
MSTRPILIIEDDDAFRQILVETISDVGAYVTTEASTAAHATELLSDPDARYDLVLLDLGLPDGDGRTLCHTIRKIGHRMPIIILSGTMDESDVIGGLDAGASDYIMKPIRAAELLARIKAQLRTFEVSEDAVFTIGPYTFRPSQKVLIAPRGRRIRLTHKETTLLRYFYKHQNRVISRVTLLADVWGLQHRCRYAYRGNASVALAHQDRLRVGDQIAGDDGRRLHFHAGDRRSGNDPTRTGDRAGKAGGVEPSLASPG